MSAAKRLSKRQLRDDKFVDIMLGYADKIRERQGLLVGIVIVLLALILGSNWTRNAMRANEVEAQQAFSTALKTLETAMAVTDGPKYDEPLLAFEAIRADNAGRDVGKWSLYYIGFCQESESDYLVAEETYKEYLSADPGGEFVIAAKLGIATCNAGVGRVKRQADFLVELADEGLAGEAQNDAWRFQAAEVYMDNGYFDLARTTLTGIRDRVDAGTRKQIDQMLGALTSTGS